MSIFTIYDCFYVTELLDKHTKLAPGWWFILDPPNSHDAVSSLDKILLTFPDGKQKSTHIVNAGLSPSGVSAIQLELPLMPPVPSTGKVLAYLCAEVPRLTSIERAA